VRTVLAAVELMNRKNWYLNEETVVSALKEVQNKTGLGGRWEVIRQKPTVVLEVAHNEDGIRKMIEHVQRLSFAKLHVIIGLVKDKEVEKVLALLPKDAYYYFTQAAIPRALPIEDLKQIAARFQLHGETFHNVNDALNSALKAAGEEDLLIVCGSIFLVAEVKKA
jgi:dihydrofolate synthase / folylpolyglutamate synthase